MMGHTGRIVGAVLAAALLVGCPLPKIPGAMDDDSDYDDEPIDSDEDVAQPDSFAGKWTREDNGAVFEVSDDGTTVRGKLIDGDEEYLEIFESYEFELERKGGRLAGKGRMVFKDTPDEIVETAWEVSQDGDRLKAKLEYVDYDDDGNETGRGSEDKVFAFEPSESAAPVAAAYTPPAVDMSAYVTVMPTYKYMLFEDMSVGQWIDERLVVAGQEHMTRTAIVGETDDAWIIEIDNQMNKKDLLIAVFVDKESGKPLQAYVGKRGEDGKEKDVPPMPKPVGGDAPDGEDDQIDVGAGSFDAIRYESGGMKTWTGVDGDTEGVLLKMSGPNFEDELVEIDADQTFDAGGTEFAAKYLRYKGTMGEQWHATGDKPYFNAMLKMKTSAMIKELVEQGDDAEPAFNYER